MAQERPLVAGIETGGTKILARITELDGSIIAAERWPTGSADAAAEALAAFLTTSVPGGRSLGGVGIAAFGPIIIDPASKAYGEMLATPKPGWTGSNLRFRLQERLAVPVAVDSDVNAAAVAEQRLGAGEGLVSVAYVTVGTGIGAGLAQAGRGLHGALHPEAGHLRLVRQADDGIESVCPYHSDCAEGLASGPAVQRRLGGRQSLAEAPEVADLLTDYLAELARILVLTWSPHRIVWGGGVMGAMPMTEEIQHKLLAGLGGYGVGDAVHRPGFCAAARLEHAGLEGALLMARGLVS